MFFLLVDAQRQQKGDDQPQQKQDCAQRKGLQQILQHLWVKFRQIRIDDHCWDDQIEQQIGKRLFRLDLDRTRFHAGKASKNQ